MCPSSNGNDSACEIDGHPIEYDASHVGVHWVLTSPDTLPASIRLELEGEIIDGNRPHGHYTASNGITYRW
jgi:hypothetical protein